MERVTDGRRRIMHTPWIEPISTTPPRNPARVSERSEKTGVRRAASLWVTLNALPRKTDRRVGTQMESSEVGIVKGSVGRRGLDGCPRFDNNSTRRAEDWLSPDTKHRLRRATQK